MESAENQPRSSSQPKKTGDLSRIETIKLLNDSIDRLEQTIKNISQDSAKLPSSDSINSLLATTKELADTVTPAPELVTATAPPIETIAPEPVVTTPTPPVEATASVQAQADTKPKTPEPKSKIVKKRRQKNLIAIILGITAIATAIVAVFWLWLPNQQAKTFVTEPIVSEPTTEIVTNFNDTEPTVDLTEPSTEDNITVEEVEDLSAEVSDTLTSEEIVEVPIPQTLESPAKAENLKVVEVQPKVIFTPEQKLVAALPTKISEAMKDYTDFVEAIKVNLSQGSLVVEITGDWYSLDESRQNKLAGKMLERSRQLDFNKLELKDSTGTLVARSPVIGDRIIILERGQDKQSIVDN